MDGQGSGTGLRLGRMRCPMAEDSGIEPLRPSLDGFGLASRPIAALAIFRDKWRMVGRVELPRPLRLVAFQVRSRRQSG